LQLPAQVLFEDAVLFQQVRDHLKLPAIHPSREGDEKNPVLVSLRDWASAIRGRAGNRRRKLFRTLIAVDGC
jgi:hypothetical protein